ncbi:MAG: DNA-processing protein DprA [Pedobacter sp.]|nr:DNA-processing protein DprA [Pedobacter sp.]
MTTYDSATAPDWLRLWRLLEQSSQSAHFLLQVFSSPAAALMADGAAWRAAGVAPQKVRRLELWRQGKDPELQREMDEGVAADIAWSEAAGQRLLTLDDADYPRFLREIADPPPLLFLRGNGDLTDFPQVALVGSRQPSVNGREDAVVLAAELASSGLVITSGLARGIDAAAHAGCLRAGGKTIAVLGAGVDQVYPRENSRLQAAILERDGLLLSEFRPGTPPLPQHFPRRNRIISGLSLGVLVVEAALESGSLITARLAAEQGRMVWALPGSRHHAQSQGCLKLIREGATMVTQSRHILSDLPPMLGLYHEVEAPTPKSKRPRLERQVQLVLEAMGQECRHADWLIAATGQPAAAVLSALSVLEMEGLVVAVPGGYERLPLPLQRA